MFKPSDIRRYAVGGARVKPRPPAPPRKITVERRRPRADGEQAMKLRQAGWSKRAIRGLMDMGAGTLDQILAGTYTYREDMPE